MRNAIVQAGGGSWGLGFLYLYLSSSSSTAPIEILNIEPHRDRVLDSPEWIYQSGGGCGGPVARVFNYNLDKREFKDGGVKRDQDGTIPSDEPTEPLGANFLVTKQRTNAVLVAASACKGNYEFSLSIDYTISGQSGSHEVRVGPFKVFSVGDNTTYYSGQQNSTGHIVLDKNSTRKISGSGGTYCAP